MNPKKVSQQYITKSKLTLYYISKGGLYEVEPDVEIGNVAYRLHMPGCDKHLPDFYIRGTFHQKKKSFELTYDQLGFFTHALYITGVPAGHLDLNDFKLRDCIWSSYYEDEKGGYLFQVLPMDTLLLTINHHKDEDDE